MAVNIAILFALLIKLQSTIGASIDLCANDNFTIYDADMTYCSTNATIADARLVQYLNSLYVCKWWTKGGIPGSEPAWSLAKECDTKAICDLYTEYNADTKYCESGTSYVEYNDKIYMCSHFSQGRTPGIGGDSDVWKSIVVEINCTEITTTTIPHYSTEPDDDTRMTSPTILLFIYVIIISISALFYLFSD